MLQGEHSAILLTFIKLPFIIKIFVLSIFEWWLMTGVTVLYIVLRSKILSYHEHFNDNMYIIKGTQYLSLFMSYV